MNYIDLSHTFTDNMPVFPGDPLTSLKQITTIAENGYTDHQLSSVMHVGTHMDAPLHMIEGGKYMDEYPPEKFIGPGVLVNVYKKSVIDVDALEGITVPKKSIVLLYTGMSEHYGTEYYNSEYPKITEDFAKKLVELGVSIIGMDMLNPDKEESFPIHKILLSKEVLIIENLTNLHLLSGATNFEVFAFPIKLHAEAASVRVVARM
jgi:kynurenine formamidase